MNLSDVLIHLNLRHIQVVDFFIVLNKHHPLRHITPV